MKTFDPKKVAVVFNNIQMGGFAQDTLIEIDFLEDAFAMEVGVDGEGTRVKSNNQGASVKVHLMQSSGTNGLLNAVADSDRVSNGGVGVLMIADKSGTTLALAQQAFVKKKPPVTFGKKANTFTWEFLTDNLQILVGGN